MNKLLLQNYALSTRDMIQSLFVSEYGLRHLAQAKTEEGFCKWGHRIIAVIQLCPVLGLIATIIESIIAKCLISREILAQSSPLPVPMTWFFRGTQHNCSGPVPVDKVEAVRAQLQALHPEGIAFNPNKVTDEIEGGTCTAMSLEFIDEYFKQRKIHRENPNAQSDALVKRIIQLGKKYTASSEEMRIRQAAFNTIEVTKANNGVDYSKNKVQSLANYHSLAIDHSSSEIDTETLKNANEMAPDIDALPEGTYLIRILKPDNNEKLEDSGHSLAYVKEEGIGLFYDPNFGAKNLPPSSHAQTLFQGFKDNLQIFGINKARFYRLQPA
jgi:hypothetical protein